MQAKTYLCDFCKFQTTTLDKLRDHQYNADHLYYCDQPDAKGVMCEAYFVSENKLVKHLNKTGHGETGVQAPRK